jgi:predicted nucleic acid-binding protein
LEIKVAWNWPFSSTHRKIEGEQAAKGFVIAFPDLVIGVTALHLGYSAQH